MKYPKVFRIVATLRAPADATEEDVRQIIRSRIFALDVKTVNLESDGDRKDNIEQIRRSTTRNI